MAGMVPRPPSSVAMVTAASPGPLRPTVMGARHRRKCTSSPPMGSTARGAQGRKTARESYFTVDSRKIIRNGVAAARISRQNISIHPHRSASATVDGTTFPVSMDTAVTARVTGK